MNRREALQSLGALATATWAERGYTPEELEPLDGHADWMLQEFEPDEVSMLAEGPVSIINLMEVGLEERSLGVRYNQYEIFIEISGKHGGAWGDVYASLSPEMTRDLAVELFMAAEEYERRGPE